jgi:hypothetical protein
MKILIKWEEAAMFLLSICFFAQLHFAWWWWLVWILAPDLSMLGYLAGNRVGAICYNVVHHNGLKYFSGFQDTHLGKIGKDRSNKTQVM